MRPLLKGRSKGRPVEGKYWLGRCGPSFKTGRGPFFLGLLRFRIALCGRPLFSLAAILSLEVLPPRRQQTPVCGSTLPVGLSAGRHLPLSEEALLSGSDPWNTGFEGRSMHTLAVASIFGLLVISHSAAAHRTGSLNRLVQKPLLLRLPLGKRATHRRQSVKRLKSLQRLVSAEWTGLVEASVQGAD
jgi:hypothetical protein